MEAYMLKGKTIVLLLLVALVASAIFVQMPTQSAKAADEYTVSLGSNDQFKSFLVGKDGMALYIFTPDPLNDSVCYEACATSWPPLTVASADKLTVDEGIPGKFGTITRKDTDQLQVTYNGMPLYYWFKDAKAGDTTGHRVGRVWWVVPPATVSALRTAELGNVLVGPNGMSLYMFTKDTADTSNCYDKCAENWPPLLVDKAEDIVPGVNLLGKLGTTARTDGKLQVTYNGMPLYYWKDDQAIGETTGENVGKVWFTIAPEMVGVNEKGDGLITADGMTLYTFAKDTAGVSNCTGDCAKTWLPLTVMGKDRLSASSSLKGTWGMITRDDKSMQVTYNGLPLYLFKDDKKPGDATGVSENWPLAKP
jgi:predicted lipoprotein with Yx(FWY)xxD motif